MKKNIAILAHVDAGKTTFSEQLLYNRGVIRNRGRVDDGTTLLDTNEIERQRGITVFADQAAFSYGKNTYTLIDTPGHIDFTPETERALQAADYAICVLSAVEGIQGHTETLWRLLDQYQVPVFFFLNKTDREGADPAAVRKDLADRFSISCPNLHMGLSAPQTIEALAESDETLLELYLNGQGTAPCFLQETIKAVKERRIFPCMEGSALLNLGIDSFFAVLDALTETSFQTDASFGALAYKIRHDAKGNRLTFLKITSGVLHVKDAVTSPTGEIQKVNEIRFYNGEKFTPADRAEAGDLCAVTGLSFTRPGEGIGVCQQKIDFSVTPLLTAKVRFDPSLSPTEVQQAFEFLADEEPMLGTVWNEKLQELQVRIMGTVQTEVLCALVPKRFGFPVAFDSCKVLYKETIAAPVTGCGHFEPLKHYAEVHLRLAPGPRGSGIQFDSICPTDVLDKNWQRLIRTHVFEKEHLGVATGAPITDISITLCTGRAHIKHTEGGDFREATYRAIRQGLMQAETVLLEPVYRFSITVPADLIGRVMADIQRMSGNFQPPESRRSGLCLTGTVPVSEAMEYPKEFLSFTKGHGTISTVFGGYQPCHNAAEVIENAAYQPESDLENTPDSVFCSHGSGYGVKWFDAPKHMHCKV